MKIKISLISIILLSGMLFAQEGQEDQIDTFTNLFEEDTVELTDEVKKRSHHSVFDSGNKIGYRTSFTYVVRADPGMNFAFHFDVPFAKRWSFVIEGGPQFLKITNFQNSIGSNYPNSFITNSTTAKGNAIYLSFSGQLKLFARSFYFGFGFSFSYFMFGNVYWTPDSPSKDGIVNYYPINAKEGKNMFAPILSFGYLSELKENVFVAPEFTIGMDLVDIKSTFKPKQKILPRIFMNMGLALSFKL